MSAEWKGRADGSGVSLDEKRSACRCEPWAQRWRADHPEVCVNCGGLFPARSVEARRPRPGEVIPSV